MTLDSYWDSCSIDSHPSGFTDGAEAILVNAEGDGRSRCSTPESHRDCHEYGAYGQGAPVYSCGCYNYSEVERYKHPKPSPPNLEQVLEIDNGKFGDIDVLSLKRKIRDENDILHSFFDDSTDVQAVSVPAIELPPSKRRKLGRHEPLEGGLTQSLAKIAEEVVVLGEALVRIKEVLDMQDKISSCDL